MAQVVFMTNPPIITQQHSNIPFMFDYCADPVVHLLLLHA